MSRKEKQYHFIYKTTDTRNGNFYIGMHSTDNLNDGYVGSGKRLKKLIYKYGKEIFNMEILEFLPNRQLLKLRESEIVNSDLLLESKCMNLKPGGYGGFSNEEHQLKCSQAAGKKHSKRLLEDEEYRKNYSEKQSQNGKKRYKEKNLKGFTFDWTGKKHSEETKSKMSEIKKGSGLGQKNSQFDTIWITKENRNKKINKVELKTYLNEGWKRGRIIVYDNSKNKSSKLTENDVVEIKKLLKDSKIPKNKIAEKFNVTPKTIYQIQKGLIWKHII